MALIQRAIPILFAGLVAVLCLHPTPAAAQDGRFQAGFEAYQKQDFKGALYYWQPLADGGDMRAQYNLGLMYLYGQGIKRDVAEALKWLLLARDQHMDLADQAVAELETNKRLETKDLNEGLKRRDDWKKAHGQY